MGTDYKLNEPYTEFVIRKISIMVDVQVLQTNLFSPLYIPSYLAIAPLKIN